MKTMRKMRESSLRHHREKMLAGTEVLWEEKLSYYDLMVMKVTEGEASFNSEEQNEPINPEDCVFNEEWFDYYNEAEMDFKTRIFSSLALFLILPLEKSKKKRLFCLIITLAKSKDYWLHVCTGCGY